MLTLAFWLLLAAAVGGLAIATLDLGVALVRAIHGLIAAVGLVALLVGALGANSSLVWTAFGLIALGFAAGAVFFGLVWRENSPPRLLVAGHGLLNGAGVVLLGIAVFG